MSVYTTVTPDDLAAWLTRYALGPVRAFDPVVAGIENTNYFLTTDKGSYVLTLYERLPAEELPFYLNLMAHLARAGVTAPAPEADRTGALFSFLNGKPAGLVARLPGAPVERPDTAHCAAVGRALAELHVATWTPPAPVDVLFSNATLHWIDDHAALFPRLVTLVAAGGARRSRVALGGTERAPFRRAQAPDGFRQGGIAAWSDPWRPLLR